MDEPGDGESRSGTASHRDTGSVGAEDLPGVIGARDRAMKDGITRRCTRTQGWSAFSRLSLLALKDFANLEYGIAFSQWGSGF